jgi:prepilin-type N-terminal cleavage/methylation domain-containing protein
MQEKHAGFTLIELAVVLVIIGFITGSVFVGRELIHAAQVRQQVTAIEQYNTAVNTFKGKYNCLPGDCAQAEGFGLGIAGNPGANGNGNGALEVGPAGTVFNSPEAVNFWYHLRGANLINGNVPGYSNFDSRPGLATPPLKLPAKSSTTFFANPRGGIAILPLNLDDATFGTVNLEPLFNINSREKTVWWLSTVYGYGVGYPGVFIPSDAYALDSKIDDGLPRAGSMRSIAYDIGNWHTLGESMTPNCIDFTVTPYQYNYTSTDTTSGAALCSPLILTPF